MRSIATILVTALAAIGWATCAGAAEASPMPCCAKVQQDCPEMGHLTMCCPAQQPNPESSSARLEPVVSLSVQSAAAFLVRAEGLLIVETPLRLLCTVDVSPPSRHSTDCILLI